ncbi:MAG: tetratricopeptide repeat protein, partial [Tangfeifania sp.]
MNHKFLLHNILSILLIFNVAVSGIASDVNTDSLKQVLQSTSIDSIKADALYQLATELEKTDKKQALDYYNEALEFEKNESKRASIYNSIGMYHLQRGDNSKSLNFFEKAVELLEELNDSSMLGRVYNNSAVANYWLGNSNEALTLYLGALDIRKSLNDTLGVVKVSNNIGLIYQDWELYNQAIEWHQEALLVAKDANAYHDLSYTYANIGKCHENLDDYKAALKNYRLGHENAIKADSRNEINSYLSGFYGSIYRRMNMPDSALFHFQKSLDYSHRINNTNRTAIAEYELGKTYFDLN